MRHLLQPRVLYSALLASLVSALACYPRLCLWTDRPGLVPIWYLEAVIFVGATILWGFVFAWHVPYTHRPVFMLQPEPVPVLLATLAAVVAGWGFFKWVDPALRPQLPEEYPADPWHWLATLPFLLGFNQLFLIFAPFDWLVRLIKKTWVAAGLLGVLNAALLLYKVHQLHAVVAFPLLASLMLGRVAAGFLLVALYLRGGVMLVSWWSLLFYARLLLEFFRLPGGPA